MSQSVLNLVGNLKVGFIMMWPYATVPQSPEIIHANVNNPQHLKAGFYRTSMTLHLWLGFILEATLRAIIDPNRDQFRGKVGTKIDAKTIIEAGPF